jgi:hypothetical protein
VPNALEKKLARTSLGADGLGPAVTLRYRTLSNALRVPNSRHENVAGDVKLSQPIYYLPWKVR